MKESTLDELESTPAKVNYQGLKGIIERHTMHSKNVQKPEQPSLELQLENTNYASLHKEVSETTQKLRQMRGEDIQGLSLEELQQLEKTLETGLCRVLQRKGKQIMEEINGLQQKSAILMEENARLRQQVVEMSREGKRPVVAAESENIVYEDGQSSDSVTNTANMGGPQDNCDDSSDTSLKLGVRTHELQLRSPSFSNFSSQAAAAASSSKCETGKGGGMYWRELGTMVAQLTRGEGSIMEQGN
ncbi:hypothetical protein Taro_019775 [Colocasia esculenta]|uniref:K-box domain-containing protein n=1 Tax=Colocasia esculenta TaxID=4460 RepID=A0A843V6H2_COLES|nr:hypothetical protein [Colocasia esculenta]